jgi:hypothetical protein
MNTYSFHPTLRSSLIGSDPARRPCLVESVVGHEQHSALSYTSSPRQSSTLLLLSPTPTPSLSLSLLMANK